MVRGQEAVGEKREPRKIFWISHFLVAELVATHGARR